MTFEEKQRMVHVLIVLAMKESKFLLAGVHDHCDLPVLTKKILVNKAIISGKKHS